MALELAQAYIKLFPNMDGFFKEASRKLGKQTQTIDVDADTKEASAQIDEAARDRDATIDVDADTTRARKQIDSLQKSADRAGGSAGGLSRSLVGLATVGVTALIGPAAGAAQALTGMAVATAAMVPAAGLAGGAILAGLVVPMKDLTTQLGSLGPAFASVGNSMSASFWSQAKAPIMDLVQTGIPALRSGMVGVSGAVGQTVGAISRSVQGALAGGGLSKILDAARASVDALRPGAAALSGALTSMGVAGAKYLPALSGAVGGVAQKIGDFLTNAVNSGQFDQWIQTGITLFGQLGHIAGDVFSIIKSVVGGLSSSAGGLSPLTGILDSLTQAAQNMMPFWQALGQMSSTLGTTLGSVLGAALTALTPMFTTIANALTPIVQQLGPVLVSIIQQLTPLLTMVGQIIAALLPLVVPIVQVVGQLISALLPPLIAVIQAIMPALTQVVGAIAGVLTALMPLISLIGSILTPIIQALLPVITITFNGAAMVISTVMNFISAIITAIMDAIQGNWSGAWGAISGFFVGIWNGIVAFFTPILNWLASFIAGVITGIQTTWNNIWTSISNFFSTIWDGVKGVASGVADWFNSTIVSRFNSIKDTIIQTFQNLRDGIGNAWNAIQDMAKKPVEFVVNNVVAPMVQAYNSVATKFGAPAADVPHMAKGDVRHGAQIQNRPILWAEAGPEAYIPLNGSRRSKALWAKTGQMLGMLPMADGGIIGSILGNIGGFFSDPAGTLFGGIKDLISKIGSTEWAQALARIPKSIADTIGDWVKKNLANLFGGGSSGSGAFDQWWRQAVAINPAMAPYKAIAATVAKNESNFNPAVMNNWDSNAKAGHPSGGLMQFIRPTFTANKWPGYGNWLGAVDQLLAWWNYVNRRYGGPMNIPGIKSLASGGRYVGYASGTDNARRGFAWVGENGPELVNFNGGEKVYPNGSGVNFKQQVNIYTNDDPYVDGVIRARAFRREFGA